MCTLIFCSVLPKKWLKIWLSLKIMPVKSQQDRKYCLNAALVNKNTKTLKQHLHFGWFRAGDHHCENKTRVALINRVTTSNFGGRSPQNSSYVGFLSWWWLFRNAMRNWKRFTVAERLARSQRLCSFVQMWLIPLRNARHTSLCSRKAWMFIENTDECLTCWLDFAVLQENSCTFTYVASLPTKINSLLRVLLFLLMNFKSATFATARRPMNFIKRSAKDQVASQNIAMNN